MSYFCLTGLLIMNWMATYEMAATKSETLDQVPPYFVFEMAAVLHRVCLDRIIRSVHGKYNCINVKR